VDHRDKDALWGETFDVTTDDDGGLDAGMTPEELLLILERDEDKQKAIAQESWALARSLLSARDPWRDVTTYQPPFMQDVKWLHGFQELVHEDGTDCYEAKIDDAKGRAHHFAFHFPTRWGAAAAHDVLARRLEYYGPGVKKGTRRNYASDVSWDVLVGILVAGAAWVPPGNGGGTKGVKAAVEEEVSESEEEEEEEEDEEEESSEEEEEEEEKRPTKKVNYDERTSFSAWTAAELAALEAGVKAHGTGECSPMFKQVPPEKNFQPHHPTPRPQATGPRSSKIPSSRNPSRTAPTRPCPTRGERSLSKTPARPTPRPRLPPNDRLKTRGGTTRRCDSHRRCPLARWRPSRRGSRTSPRTPRSCDS